MDSLYLLIPVALIFCAIAIRLLIWAIDSGQYDDLDKDAWRILAEERPDNPPPCDDDAEDPAGSAPRTAPETGATGKAERGNPSPGRSDGQ